MSDRFLNVAAYHFVPLDDLSRRRHELKSACDRQQLRGTILLSREGINLFLAGKEQPLRDFLQSLRGQSEFATMEVKESWSDEQPFNRMLVRLKAEIISMGIPGIDPVNRPSPKLKPRELKRWLDEGRDVLLLDVRNDYEVGVGTFKNAVPIGVDHFRHFPAAVATLSDDLKQRPVVMFCTGGIRCEKAGPYMQQQGFENIYQLDGGILKYFEDCGGAHYDGDCFVFDKRVALDPSLKESGLAMCYVCQAILSPADQQSADYVVEKSCPHCIGDASVVVPSITERQHQLRRVSVPLPGSIPYDNLRPIRIPARLDRSTLGECVRELFPHLSAEYWEDEFRLGRIRAGERIVDGSQSVRAGQRFTHWFPNTVEPAVNADIRVLLEDDALLVVDKPAPLPMHPSGRYNRNTLAYLLRLAFELPTLRPVHRLDANTTGVAVFAKTKAIAAHMQQQFDNGRVAKTYLALLHGTPSQTVFDCDEPIARDASAVGGRVLGGEDALPSLTQFQVLQTGSNQALVEVVPHTGRTNQIRVHAWHLGHPVIGDPLYLPQHAKGQTQTMELDECMTTPMCLHAWKLSFLHPLTHQSLSVEAPRPPWSELAQSASRHSASR